MMINIPSAPGGAAAAPSALPGVATGGAVPAPQPAGAEGTAAEGTGLPALFAQMLDFAGLSASAQPPVAEAAAAPAGGETADPEAATEDVPAAAVPLAAMMPAMHFAMLPAAQAQAAAGAAQADASGLQARGTTLLAAASGNARQAAADAMTAGIATANAAATPLMARLLQGALPAAEPVAATVGGESRQGAVATQGNAGAAPQAAAAMATALAAQDGAAQPGSDGQSGQQPQGDNQATFRGVMAATAPAAGAVAAADTVKLAGAPEQWQQPLRAALGDRLQVTLQKGNDQAVIRLEPPNLGSIEISIRQTAGALHVSMSATNGDVVRQLNAVGDSMRQDLSQRQFGDVAVTVSQSSRSLADSDGRGRQPEREQQEQRGPGRALNEGDVNNTTFAMLRE